MRTAVFSTHSYDRRFLEEANTKSGGAHDLLFLEAALERNTAALSGEAEAVCAFVNDNLDAAVIEELARRGVRLIALRSAGFNNVDLKAAAGAGIAVARVPAYSPEAVAEHSVALMLSLNRKIHRAYARVREGNFELEGLLGFDMRGRAAGIVGTGEIGMGVARILAGFGCRLLGFDPVRSEEFERIGGAYVDLDELLAHSEIITLHCPLTEATRHMVDDRAVALTRYGVMIINTSRGAVVDTRALIAGLKSGKIGHVGLDVYEEEAGLFFHDASQDVIQDDVFARLLTFPNVLITGHQGFFTREALTAIAETTIGNITAFERTGAPLHPVPFPPG